MEKSFSFYDVEQEIYNSRFNEALKKLEAMPTESKKTYYFFLLRGIVFFHLVKLDFAYRSFRTALELKKDDQLSKLYLACIHLKNTRTDLAIKQWMDVLHKDEKNAYAKRALSIVKNADEQSLSHITTKMYKLKMLPPFIPTEIKNRRKKRLVSGTAALLVLVLSVFFLPRIISAVSSLLMPQNERRALLEEMEPEDANIDSSAEDYKLAEILQFPAKIQLKQKDVAKIIANLETKFVKYRENEARVLINTIFFSNAEAEEKRRLFILQRSMGDASFASDLRWFDFSEMKGEMWKYHNTALRWKGTITQMERVTLEENVALKKISADFSQYVEILKANFLLNFYSKSKNLSAIVPAYFTPRIRLQEGDEVELLATIKYNEPTLNFYAPFVDAKLNSLLVVHGFRYIME